ncbi:MAG TPA: hypothetical protein GX708_03850 [Gallicola sp.]|nr:hypothetical protein [Gallicola sp.]
MMYEEKLKNDILVYKDYRHNNEFYLIYYNNDGRKLAEYYTLTEHLTTSVAGVPIEDIKIILEHLEEVEK